MDNLAAHMPGTTNRLRLTPVAGGGVALAFALAGCGGGTRTVVETGLPRTTAVSAQNAAAAAAATTGTASTRAPGAEAPTRVVSLATFQSPSGNIGCVIAGGLARCDIVQRTWQPPARPAGCPQIVDFGQGLEVGTTGPARLVCAGDTARDPASARLAYGTATRSGGFTCVSRRTGVSCTGADGHGFELSRQGYKVH